MIALRAQMTASPKPTYTLDGESYSWTEYYQMLVQRQFDLEQQRQRADGAWEVRSRGC